MDIYATKTEKQIVSDAAQEMLLLLMRFERDALALGDYLTRPDQDKLLDSIFSVVKTNLVINKRWSHEAGGLFAHAYRRALVFRLSRPDFFRTPSRLTSSNSF